MRSCGIKIVFIINNLLWLTYIEKGNSVIRGKCGIVLPKIGKDKAKLFLEKSSQNIRQLQMLFSAIFNKRYYFINEIEIIKI